MIPSGSGQAGPGRQTGRQHRPSIVRYLGVYLGKMRRACVLIVLILVYPFSVAACTGSSTSAAPECRTSQLTITAVPGGVAAGHSAIDIHFRNVSKVQCSMVGYPFVSDINAKGAPVLQAIPTPQGYIGGLRNPDTLPIVDLAPGQTATSIIEAVNSANYFPPCPTVTGETGMFVQPPGQEKGVTVPLTLGNSVCSQLEVHPVVAGQVGDSSAGSATTSTLVPALQTHNPNVVVDPANNLTSGEMVEVSVTGFGAEGKFFLSECASAADANDERCGQQLAAQPFGVTDNSGAGSLGFHRYLHGSNEPVRHLVDAPLHQPACDRCHRRHRLWICLCADHACQQLTPTRNA